MPSKPHRARGLRDSAETASIGALRQAGRRTAMRAMWHGRIGAWRDLAWRRGVEMMGKPLAPSSLPRHIHPAAHVTADKDQLVYAGTVSAKAGATSRANNCTEVAASS